MKPKLLMSLVILGTSMPAFGHLYMADVDEAQWNVDISPLFCRLWQPVPAYGRGIFENRAGERQFFKLESQKKVYKDATAKLAIVPPEWKLSAERKDIGTAQIIKGLIPMTLAEPMPSSLLDHLEAGYFPSVSHPGWYEGHEVEVNLSSVNFTSAYQEYVQCLGGLYPFNFDQLERSSIFFETDKYEIAQSYFERLKMIKGYLEVDPEVIRVVIDGHADAIGTDGYNWELSRNRAEVVAAYLRKIGVPNEKIHVRYHGERFPVAKNNSEARRQRNRRATLRLDKGNE